MSEIKQGKTRYWVRDRECIGRDCLVLGYYESRGATLGGSRNTGNTKPCCLTNAYHGCPSDAPVSKELLTKHKAEGMKNL